MGERSCYTCRYHVKDDEGCYRCSLDNEDLGRVREGLHDESCIYHSGRDSFVFMD